MQDYSRFAIYYCPEPGAFADRAAAWLGWDARHRRAARQPVLADLPRALSEITADPRRYGFHGTIKPPFRLAEQKTIEALDDACKVTARQLRAVQMPGLSLGGMDGFLALTPVGDPSDMLALAAAVVAGLDSFRAPLTAAEITRRRPDRLTDRQRVLLEAWGYPFVMDEFQFHLTLSGRLSAAEMGALTPLAEAHFEGVLPQPFSISDLCLCGEAPDGRFHILHRYPLSA